MSSLLCLAGTAQADSGNSEPRIGKLHAGMQAGLVLPQIQSELGTDFGVEAEVGYQAWRQLSPYVSIGYMQPGVDNSWTRRGGAADGFCRL